MTSSALGRHLAALQTADSLFPSGLYAQSFGLEAYVQAGLVRDAADLESFAADLLEGQVGPGDGVAAAWAWRGADRGDPSLVREADLALDAAKIVEAAREASASSGRRVLDVAGVVGLDGPLRTFARDVRRGATPGHHAVAAALLEQAQGVDADRAVAGGLYAVAAAVGGAGMRLLPIDHLEVQRILLALRPRILQVTEHAIAAPLADLGGWAPALDALAMAHARSQRRLFAT